MNHLDLTPSERLALRQLAATMTDDPGRPGAVTKRVRRRHQRRYATRASLGLALAATTGAVLMSGRPSPNPVAPAASPVTTAAPATALAIETCDALKARTIGNSAGPNGAGTANDDPTRIKATGTITAIDGDALTIHVDDGNPALGDVSGTLAADASYSVQGATTATRPELRIGERVGFSATKPGDTYSIDFLDGNAGETSKPTAPTIDRTGAADAYFKGYGTVVAVNDATITIDAVPGTLIPGQPAEVTAPFSATAEFFDGDSALTARPAIAIGDHVAFAAAHSTDGSPEIVLLETHTLAPTVVAGGADDPNTNEPPAPCVTTPATTPPNP